MKNQFLRLNKPGEFEFGIGEISGDLLDEEVLLKIHQIGICGTDYHAFRGKQPFFTYPRVLGHELGAEVIKIGNKVLGVEVGDKVAVEPYLNCGDCQPCKLGKSNCCEKLQVLGVHTDGGMAEYIKVPFYKVHVSKKLDYQELATVEFLGIGAHAVKRASLNENDWVMVVGAGPIGLSVIQFAKLQGAKVVVVDMNQERLNFAIRELGSDMAIYFDAEFNENSIRQALNGELPTCLFDATGNPSSMKNSFDYVSFGGKIVFVGLFIGEVEFYDPLFHRKEISLLASRNSLPEDFKYIIQMMENKELNINPWLSHSCKFNELPEKINQWLEPNQLVIKALVHFD